MSESINEIVKNNLKILINKSLTKERSINAATDFIKKIENLNLSKVCIHITKLIFNEEICIPQTAGRINADYVFSIIDMDSLIFGLYKIYKYILNKVKLSKKEKNENVKIILEYIKEDPDNENQIYENILQLFELN